MKTLLAALVFALLIGALLDRCNALPGEDELFRSFQQKPQDPMRDSEESANSADDERFSVVRPKPSFTWSNCGGSEATIRIIDFRMSSTCPKSSSGKVTITSSIRAASDVSGPIKVVMVIKKKVGLIWYNICSRIPGGCVRDNVCAKGGDLTFEVFSLAEEATKGETAEVEEIDGVHSDYQSNTLQKAEEVCVRKGDSTLPPLTRDITKAPDGQYSVKAEFYTRNSNRIACLDVLFDVCS